MSLCRHDSSVRIHWDSLIRCKIVIVMRPTIAGSCRMFGSVQNRHAAATEADVAFIEAGRNNDGWFVEVARFRAASKSRTGARR